MTGQEVSYYLDWGWAQVNKHGETVCGDVFQVLQGPQTATIVLSDGLGSGIKANILSTLTSKILSTLIAKHVPLEECVDTVASSLPVCKERNLAYATFTIVQIEGTVAYLTQYDNPDAIVLRQGKQWVYEKNLRTIGEKEVEESTLVLQPEDMVLIMSDGVVNAGLGKMTVSGWALEEVAAFAERWYTKDMSPTRLAAHMVNAALALGLDSVEDDTTVLAFRLRKLHPVNIMIGPPREPQEDTQVLQAFFELPGPHILCGGTTAQMAAHFLKETVHPIPHSETVQIPAMQEIKGVDLVTEGVVTLEQLVAFAELYCEDTLCILDLEQRKDGVARLFHFLFEEATEVHLFFGSAVNPAHTQLFPQGTFQPKQDLISRLEHCLRAAGRNVYITQC